MRSSSSSQNIISSGSSGGGASPADSNKPIVISNPKFNNKMESAGTAHLYLTNIRTIQQKNAFFREEMYQQIRESREKLKGKMFEIKKEPHKFCKAHKMAILSCKDGKIETAKFTHIGCKSWTCPLCCVNKAYKVKYLLRNVIIENNLAYFLTLTLDPAKIPEVYKTNTHKYITKLFNHFVTVLKRKNITYFDKKKNRYLTFDLKTKEEKLKYVWVVEFQKKGNAHLHILLNQFLPFYALQKVWVHVGGGHILDIQRIKTIKGISNYISDYIVKGIKGDLEKPSGFRYFQRRYSISKSCIRSSTKKKAFYPRMSVKEQYFTLKSLKLDWIFNTLYNLKENDIIITFQEEHKKT